VKVESKKDGYERLAAHKVYYSLGTSSMERHQFDDAIDAFGHVSKSKDADPNEKANALLWIGKMHDTAGRRDEAIQQYDAILALNCDSDIKTQAQQYKKRPYK
jgi:tetratricopeptide (TPR) repeat protein